MHGFLNSNLLFSFFSDGTPDSIKNVRINFILINKSKKKMKSKLNCD